ncbi:MAG: hypothetical protein DME21_00290 [Verrucomicrobia bacterium]|nr:MAG: hypothetical protein DME21_00290 [Verrucomicrobiota bacterium]
MKCPRCGSILCTVEYDGVMIEVCPDCKGEWLHAGELQKIVEHHDEVFTQEEIASRRHDSPFKEASPDYLVSVRYRSSDPGCRLSSQTLFGPAERIITASWEK